MLQLKYANWLLDEQEKKPFLRDIVMEWKSVSFKSVLKNNKLEGNPQQAASWHCFVKNLIAFKKNSIKISWESWF